jgi:hypothetical protein
VPSGHSNPGNMRLGRNVAIVLKKKMILHQHCCVKNNVENSRNILNDMVTAEQKENT